MAIAKIDKGVAVSSLRRTLDSLYMSMENGTTKKLPKEEMDNITVSINHYEAILKKLNGNIEPTTDDYALIMLSFGTNASIMNYKAEEYKAAAAGLEKHAKSIEEYLRFVENQQKAQTNESTPDQSPVE